MKNKLFYILLFCIGIVTFSCKTDVELNAAWKDTPVVYGLLEPGRDTQFIKINKCFLGNTDAYAMAKEPDSLNYPYKLEVRVEKWKNGSLKKTYYLDTITIPNMNDGIFASNKNLAYYFITPQKTDPLDYDAIYKLYIRNPLTGKEITSSTSTIKPFQLIEPYIVLQNHMITFYNDLSRRFSSLDVTFTSSKNSKAFDVYTRLYYIEYHPGQNDSTQKFIDWYIGSYTTLNTDGGYDIVTVAEGEDFYKFLVSSIKEDATIKRKLGRLGSNSDQINFLVYAANEDLKTYIDVKKPSNSLVQEKPNFSNVTNALGIFASRYTLITKNITFDNGSYIYLRDSELTKHLNF